MRSIRDLKNLKGKTVLLRADFNVPIKNGKVLDDFRIKKTIPTVKFLHAKGAKITILTHLGSDGKEDLSPVIKKFFQISKLPKNDVNFLDNLRAFPGEKKNDSSFAKKLSSLGDIYVNDAFSVSHRLHASVVGIPKYLPSYAGFQLEEEIENLSRAFKNPKHPFLFILGGAKFSTKIPLIKRYLNLADHVFIGGALANDFLKTKGYDVGKSLVDDNSMGIKNLLKNKKLVLPEDTVVKDEAIIDIGAESVKTLVVLIKSAKMILWNGPLGKYEAGGGGATREVLKLVAKSKAETIIGGGDTVTIISDMKIEKKFTFISTGGGATLEFLAKGTLPGIKAIEKKNKKH